MSLAFTKMHGLGNDFVVLDCRQQAFALSAAEIRQLADRHFGVGCDQLLSIEPARDPGCAYYYGIWNADGSPSGQCGNGVRCVAAWLARAGLLQVDQPVRIESPSGPVSVRVLADGQVAVDMGVPRFEPAALPYTGEAEGAEARVQVLGQHVSLGLVSMGNPHAVLRVPDLQAAELDLLGPALTAHPQFPQGVNVGFVEPQTADRIKLRVHERGSGWTLACGTGACAAVAVLRQRGQVGPSVEVELPGGCLRIDWPGVGQPLWMTGPAAWVFSGELSS